MGLSTDMIASLYEKFLAATGVSTDTRNIREGSLFFALKGPHFDANQFAKQAIEKGAAFAVVDDPAYAVNDCYVTVPNGLKALQALANHHRKQFKIPFIAITGSNGKTTTKELMRDVLSVKYNVLATEGNLNNHIGVPLTLLRVRNETEVAIIEMGANHVGEIAALCRIAEPTHGLITNIGKAHLEGFGGQEGVIRGKSELYHYLIGQEGVLFVNNRDAVLANMAQKRIKNPYDYPEKGNYYEATLLQSKPYVKFKAMNGDEVSTRLPGAYNFDNIATALCVGKFFEVEATAAHAKIAAYEADNNRSQVIQRNNTTIIMDAYNANPTSMKLALEGLAAMDGSPKVAILGDMLELGSESAKEHGAIGHLIGALGIDMALFCGKEMREAHLKCPSSQHFDTMESLKMYLSERPISNGAVLIKGSRGMALENIVPYIDG